MDCTCIAALREAGVDTEGALRRFSGNGAVYRKFLLKFLRDDTFDKIKPAMQANDWDTALGAAHTLKGVAGNLGLDPLASACSDTVSLLREQDYDNAVKAYEKLESQYIDIVGTIRLFKEG